jgi:flagellar motor switch protein FliN/FliY
MTTIVPTAVDGWLETAAAAAAEFLAVGEQLRPGQVVRGAEDLGLPIGIVVRFGGAVSGEFALFVDSAVTEALRTATIGSLDVAEALAPTLQAIAAALGTNAVGAPQTLEADAAMQMISAHREHGVITLVGAAGVRAAVAIGGEGAARGNGSSSIDRFDLLRGVEMQASVELGRARLTINELLSLHAGEVIELDRAAGETADLFVNGRLIAHGEVVVVDENYGLRITELVTDDVARSR